MANIAERWDGYPYLAHFAAQAGDRAYLDSFVGLVPCRVTCVLEPGSEYSSTIRTAIVRYTANRPGYRRGEIGVWNMSRIIPRKGKR